MATKKADDEVSTWRFCKMFEDASEATSDARQLAERDRDYRDNKQWTVEEESAIKSRGQPVITKNRIAPKVDFLLGTERKTRTDPKAFPREPGDEKAAEAATDALRYIADYNDFDQVKSDVFENIIIEGFGGSIVEVDAKGNIAIRWIPWDRLFYDPHSFKRNFSDARYKGIVAWLDEDEARELYPDMVDSVYEYYAKSVTGETYEDKPHKVSWYDRERRRVMAIELYYLEKGKWMRCVVTQGGFFEKPAPSPYQDEYGETICPIEMQSCYVDRDNNRYGVVRGYISAQDEINKRTSKALHLISMRQFMYEKGAVDDLGATKRELAKPDGGAEINPGFKFELLNTNDMAQGNVLLLQEAKSEIDNIGASAALQGKENQGASGRALQARQQGGLIELGPIFDGLRQWEKAIYRQCWYRVRQFWDAPKWIRVTDNEDNLKYVGLNQPKTRGQMALEKAEADGMPSEQLQALAQQMSMDPMAQQMETQNDVKSMDMDIIIAEQPDTVTLQGETFEALVQMYQAAPDKVPFEVIIEASPLRSSVKEKIMEKLVPNPQAQQQMQQAQQAQMELQMRGAQAEIAGKEADAANKASSAQLNQAKTETEKAKLGQIVAETAQTKVSTLETLLMPPPGAGEEPSGVNGRRIAGAGDL